jgi:hypothetical protein
MAHRQDARSGKAQARELNRGFQDSTDKKAFHRKVAKPQRGRAATKALSPN